ncbi:MAG: saccharopine dehydrogenase NADP-binding domain-containing protein [Pseudomonadota bacterium]
MTDEKPTDLDVILWGATSFVGSLTAKFMMGRHGSSGESLKWGMGARSQSKIDALKAELGPGADEIPVFIGDSHDPAFLADMVKRTKVVLATVGPFMQYGKELVAACAEAGTDYCDVTGEVPFIHEMIERHHDQAVETGARLISCCGVDSVPSDLGVFFLNEEAKARFGEPVTLVNTRIKTFKGAFSGGTVASLAGIVSEARKDRALARVLKDPYALCPADRRKGPTQPNLNKVEYDHDLDRWLAPFVMAAINTRIVHASNARLGYPYSEKFLYDEKMIAKGKTQARALTAGLAGFMVGLSIKPAKWALDKLVLPKPGEGPSPKEQEEGFFRYILVGKTDSGKTIKAEVTGDRDPGYGATAKMLGEAAASMAQDISKDALAGGYWTPASAMGMALVERLRAHSGMTFEIVD